MNKKEKQITREIAEIIIYIIIGYLIAFGANRGLSYALGTDLPVVAVVSRSMEHQDPGTYKAWFEERDYNQSMADWSFSRGMQKGELVVVKGVELSEVEVGDVIVYKFPEKEPIIHRVVKIENEQLYTKGDNNQELDQNAGIAPPIKEENLEGKAVLHVPLFGWVKIGYMSITGGF